MSTSTDPVVYLDHAATTPMVPAALEAVARHLGAAGNASSLHASGRRARRVVEESRETIAQALGCRPGEVVFTSGGTEADNLAVKGLAWRDGVRGAGDPPLRVVTSAVEHHAVLDPVHWLAEAAGAEVLVLDVDHDGRVDPAQLATHLEQGPAALVSVMWANNEVGTLQPVEELVAVAAGHRVPVHTDAVQALGAVPLDFAASGVDAMTITGHKVGGPYGVGALLVRRELDLAPLVHGGGQERDMRSGTLDVPAIAGFAAAVELAVKRQVEHAARLAALRDRLVAGVLAAVPDARPNGHAEHRLPGNAHLSFPGCEGDSLLMLLDARGIECSTGSACSAGVPQASHVLLAMGRDDQEARGSLRFSLGHSSTEADVDAVLAAIGPCVERARAAGAARA